jgi:hypothetical protein
VWFWGLEVTSSDIMRKTEQEGSFPGGVHDAVTSFGKGHKFINLIVHDGNRNGLDDANWDNSFDQEFYGCIVYYNGWQSTDRGHGHGIYMQNQSKRKTISDCIFFKQFGWGIHLYGTSNAHMENIDILNNISFDNGALAGRPSQNLLVTGGATKPTNIKVIDNCTFHSKPGDSCQISKANGVDIQGNYIGGDGININNWGKGAIQGNTFIGKFSGPTLDPEWKNVVMENPPKDAVVFVRANKYEPGERANVVVYNWAGLDSVKVDLSKSGFKPGTKVEIRDVQNYFGKPAFTGGFQKELTLPMNLTEVAAPVGKVTADPVHTPKQFNVFVILKARAK